MDREISIEERIKRAEEVYQKRGGAKLEIKQTNSKEELSR